MCIRDRPIDFLNAAISVGPLNASNPRVLHSTRNGSSLQPSSRSILTTQKSNKHGGSLLSHGPERHIRSKFESPDREKFRYNMIYNKMHHLLNDESQKRKRQIMGSRNLNTQAKIMITQPSEISFSGQISQNKVGFPALSPANTTKESFNMKSPNEIS